MFARFFRAAVVAVTPLWIACKYGVFFAARWWMRAHGATVPSSCRIFGFPIFIQSKADVRLGERVNLHNLPMLYGGGATFPACSFSLGSGASIEIGDDTYAAFAAFSAQKKISIGKRVLIASGCRIFDSDAHAVDRIPRMTHDGEGVCEVRIEDDVWLASDVMVCKGVTIGKGSVIGAKSLVTHDIPPGVLAAGSPAEVIRPLRFGDRSSTSANP